MRILIVALVILSLFGCKDNQEEVKQKTTETPQEIDITLNLPKPQGIDRPEFIPSELILESKTHLFILSGQSNMVHLSEEVFKLNVAIRLLNDRTIVVKNAKSGRPIKDWYPNGYLYDALMDDVWDNLDHTPDTITFVWMQGEADAAYPTSFVYAENLEGLINQLRLDLNHQDINVIIGRISDFGANDHFIYWDTMRSQQELLTKEKGYSLINTDDLNGVDNGLHYTPEGYEILAQRFADEAVRLIKNLIEWK